MGQLTAQVGVVVGGGSVGPLGAHTVGVVGEPPSSRGSQSGHGSKLSAVLPAEVPGKIVGRIADLVTDNGFVVVGSQQVAPLGVAVAIVGLCTSINSFSGVGIDRPGQNIACIIIGPDRSGVSLFIIFPDQLIGRIVGIAGRICAVKTVGEAKETDKLSP